MYQTIVDNAYRVKNLQNSTSEFKQNFLLNIKKFEYLNKLVPEHTYDHYAKYLRIMTWNVRYFTNINNEPTFDKFIETIIIIKPDILCLNEATLGNNIYYQTNPPDVTQRLSEIGYKFISLCNVVPAWFSSFYGNMIFIKTQFYKQMCDSGEVTNFNILDINNKCHFNQYSETLDYPKPNIINVQDEQVASFGTSETRCYIKITLPVFDLVLTHLEAYDINTRKKQIRQILDNCVRPTIITGDLNIIQTYQYPYKYKDSVEWTVIKNNNDIHDHPKDDEISKLVIEYDLETSFSLSGTDYQGFTTWTNTIVDYFLFAKWDKYEDEAYRHTPRPNSYVYFVDASDHIPIIVDIENSTLTNIKNIKFSDENLATIQSLPLTSVIDADTILYNVEPLAAIDWFNNGKISNNFGFVDRFLTGNFSLTLGSSGIYIGKDANDAVHFLNNLINKTDQKNFFDIINHKDKKIGLLYQFKLIPNIDLSDSKASYVPYGLGSYKNRYDIENVFVAIKGTGETNKLNFTIGKITPSGRKLFYLHRIDMIIDLFDKGTKIDPDVILSLFAESFKYIREKTKNNNYIFDPNYVTSQIFNDVSIPSYPIFANSTFVHVGGNDNLYSYKYKKYESKYLKIKNNK